MEIVSPILENNAYTLVVESDESIRIDRFLPTYFSDYSRNFFQKLIDQQHIKLNGEIVHKNGIMLKSGDRLDVYFPPSIPPTTHKTIPEHLSIPIIYEHEHFLIIAKPTSLMIHRPTTTSMAYTLVDWLRATRDEFAAFGDSDRPGIVHRLDKNTSGLMIVARNTFAQALLSNLFKQRAIKKTYLAIVEGLPPTTGTINYSINRDLLKPTHMTHRYAAGREALTHYKVQRYFDTMTLVEAHPITGRTHQLRVHFAGLGHPIVGDPHYGTASKLIKRQALHAWRLSFSFQGQQYEFQQEPPVDFQALVSTIANEQKQ